MARTGFDTYQCGSSSALATLQPRSELVRMTWNDSIIVVPGRDQSSRIPSPGLKPMKGGVLSQIRKLLGIFGTAKFADPSPTDGEFMESEHVHDSNGR